MLLFVIVGLPGSFTDACRDICLELLREAGHSPQAIEIGAGNVPPHLNLDSLGRLASQLLQADCDIAVAVSRQSDQQFIETLAALKRPFLLVLDDPRWVALTTFEQGGGSDLPNAIRSTVLSSACLTDLLSASTSEILIRDKAIADASGTARHCLKALGCPYGDDDVRVAAEIASRHLAGVGGIRPNISSELRNRVGDESALAVEGALSGFWAAFNGRPLGPVIATRLLFYLSETSAPVASTTIDATGRARLLAFGPYLNLPAGNWTLRLVLAFSPELAGTPFTLDVTRFMTKATEELGRVSFAGIVGRYVAQITFNHREPSKALEFRLFIDRPTFEGRISLGYAELQRLESQVGDDANTDLDWKMSP